MTIESAAFLPLSIVPDMSEWALNEPVGVFMPQFGHSTTQRVRYGVARWRAKLTWTNLSQDHRHLLMRFVNRVGSHRAFWVHDFSHNMRGSMPSSELLTNHEIGSAWTANTGRSASTDSGGVRVTRTSATSVSGIGLTTPLTVTANAYYAWRCLWEPGAGDISVGLSAGSARYGTTYGNAGVSTTPGRRVLSCLPTGSSMYVNVHDSVSADANYSTQQPYYVIRGMSVARMFRVDGGTGALAQSGSSVYVKNLPTGTAGLLKAGDFVEFVSTNFSQLVRLVEDLNADSSGTGHIVFEPGLHAPVSANDMVIPTRPMAQMVMTDVPKITTRHGWYSDIEINCEEVFQ